MPCVVVVHTQINPSLCEGTMVVYVCMWRCALSTLTAAQHIGRSGLAQLVVMTTSDVRGEGARKAKLRRWRLVRGGDSIPATASLCLSCTPHTTERAQGVPFMLIVITFQS